MTQESKKQRLLDAYDYLYYKGIVHSVKELADKMGRSRPGVSKALNGSPDYLNDKFLTAFVQKFDMFSLDWLITGEGSMFTSPFESKDNNLDHGSLINAAMAAKDETIRAKDETIASLRETIEAQKNEIYMLKQQIVEIKNNEILRDYQFPVGVAEKNEDVRPHV